MPNIFSQNEALYLVSFYKNLSKLAEKIELEDIPEAKRLSPAQIAVIVMQGQRLQEDVLKTQNIESLLDLKKQDAAKKHAMLQLVEEELKKARN